MMNRLRHTVTEECPDTTEKIEKTATEMLQKNSIAETSNCIVVMRIENNGKTRRNALSNTRTQPRKITKTPNCVGNAELCR